MFSFRGRFKKAVIKPWIRDGEEDEMIDYVRTPFADLKHRRLNKPEREEVKFIERK